MTELDAFPLIERGEALLTLGRPAEAERFGREALAADPLGEGGHALLSRALGGQGRFADAVAAAEAGLAARPDSEWLHRVRALALWQGGRHRDALAAADGALRIDPHSAGAHHLRAIALSALRRTAEARAAAAEAVRLQPGDAAFRAELGNTWLRESPEQAAEHYRASLALDPQQPLTLNNLGVALLRLRRLETAAEAFRAALALDPAQRHAKLNIYRATNPILRARWLGWIGLPIAVAAIVLFLRFLAGYPETAWAGWLAAALWFPWLIALKVHQRAGLRRLAADDPATNAVRGRVLADLNADRLSPGPGIRHVGTVLLAVGAVGAAFSAVLATLTVHTWLKGPRDLSGAGMGVLATLIMAGCGAALLREGRKLRRLGRKGGP